MDNRETIKKLIELVKDGAYTKELGLAMLGKKVEDPFKDISDRTHSG